MNDVTIYRASDGGAVVVGKAHAEALLLETDEAGKPLYVKENPAAAKGATKAEPETGG